MVVKRQVHLVDEEPHTKFSKHKLYGYSAQAIAGRARCSVATIKRAIAEGKLDLASMESTEAWLAARRERKAKSAKRRRKKAV